MGKHSEGVYRILISGSVNGFAVRAANGLWRLCDRNGRDITEPIFERPGAARDELARRKFG
jgi:hypothetical protein